MINYFLTLPHYLQALDASLFTWLLASLGSAVVFIFKKINNNIMDAMLALSSGIMLSAAYWSLLNPAITISNNLNLNTPFVLALGFSLGAIFLYFSDEIFSYLLNKKEFKNNDRLKRCRMLIFSIAIHNIPQGLSIGIVFGSITNNSYSLLFTSLILVLGIGIQNFPEGTAISLPLRREGYSRLKAFLIGILIGLIEPISAVIGSILVLRIENIMPYFLTFAAGSMMYVVIEELIPETQNNSKKGLMAIFTLLGFLIMTILNITLA